VGTQDGADPDAFLPLPSATLHILVALTTGEKHGYAIMGDVEALSDGAVRMGPGTLYGSIKRMLADGLIEESDERPDAGLDDQRRRYYRLTGLGERVCTAELQRLERLIRRAGSPEWATRRLPRLREA
jgi:DNA-binding PadR family transcriptional regulator